MPKHDHKWMCPISVVAAVVCKHTYTCMHGPFMPGLLPCSPPSSCCCWGRKGFMRLLWLLLLSSSKEVGDPLLHTGHGPTLELVEHTHWVLYLLWWWTDRQTERQTSNMWGELLHMQPYDIMPIILSSNLFPYSQMHRMWKQHKDGCLGRTPRFHNCHRSLTCRDRFPPSLSDEGWNPKSLLWRAWNTFLIRERGSTEIQEKAWVYQPQTHGSIDGGLSK